MGASIGAIAITTGTKQIDISQMFADLITQNFKELKETELWNPDSRLSFDSRKKDCFSIAKSDDLIVIINSQFTAELFKV